jgi:hypothetical protein
MDSEDVRSCIKWAYDLDSTADATPLLYAVAGIVTCIAFCPVIVATASITVSTLAASGSVSAAATAGCAVGCTAAVELAGAGACLATGNPCLDAPGAPRIASKADAVEPIGGAGAPRFVAADEGIIDTAAPTLRQQIDNVADSILSTGSPPTGERQGGLPGKPGIWGNKALSLPKQAEGYYTESDVWPGVSSRGTERIVVGSNGEVWYSPDHYGTLRRVR